LQRGLETIRRLDAAAGGPGNHISFGPWDRRGYKGDFVVMRQVPDGKNVVRRRSIDVAFPVGRLKF
jgi:branched-chain amino acid transport system substrate-binding protein